MIIYLRTILIGLITIHLLSGCKILNFLKSLPDPVVVQMGQVKRYKDNFKKLIVENDATIDVYQTGHGVKNKNVIFLAADANIQTGFSGPLEMIRSHKKKYQDFTQLRLEDLVWWEYYPILRKLYKQIVHIPLPQSFPTERIRYKNLKLAFDYLQQQEEDYDVIILSHGSRNQISDGLRGYFLSYQELETMSLSKLDFVFLQGCESATNWKSNLSLMDSFLGAGAQRVMAFEGFNRNFFFISFLIKNWLHHDLNKAYELTRLEMKENLQKEPYKTLVQALYALQLDPEGRSETEDNCEETKLDNPSSDKTELKRSLKCIPEEAVIDLYLASSSTPIFCTKDEELGKQCKVK